MNQQLLTADEMLTERELDAVSGGMSPLSAVMSLVQGPPGVAAEIRRQRKHAEWCEETTACGN